MRKPFIIIGLLLSPILVPLLYSIIASIVLSIFGYYPDAIGIDVARQLAKDKGKAQECAKIIHPLPHPFSPSGGEQRANCFFEYAKILQDPTACKFLLPSDYGLSCIGEVGGKLIDESNCHWYKDNAVRCFEGEALVPHIYDCSTSQIDECKHRRAFKSKNEADCDGIGNPILRSVCKVRVETWKKYPQLRRTIYFNDNIQ